MHQYLLCILLVDNACLYVYIQNCSLQNCTYYGYCSTVQRDKRKLPLYIIEIHECLCLDELQFTGSKCAFADDCVRVNAKFYNLCDLTMWHWLHGI
jgi:hypothetical protein